LLTSASLQLPVDQQQQQHHHEGSDTATLKNAHPPAPLIKEQSLTPIQSHSPEPSSDNLVSALKAAIMDSSVKTSPSASPPATPLPPQPPATPFVSFPFSPKLNGIDADGAMSNEALASSSPDDSSNKRPRLKQH
jgi:hypothetical protein